MIENAKRNPLSAQEIFILYYEKHIIDQSEQTEDRMGRANRDRSVNMGEERKINCSTKENKRVVKGKGQRAQPTAFYPRMFRDLLID